MSYPQINTYPLTLGTAGNYAESLKTEHTAFTPRQSVFFMPMAWMRVGNIQYRPEPLCSAFSESTPLFCGITKKEHKMTTLSDTYDAYVKLRQILNNINQKPDEAERAADAVCAAMCSLETACAYIPMTEKEDRRIKFALLKSNLTAHTEDFNNIIHPEELTDREKEALTMVEQLMREEK